MILANISSYIGQDMEAEHYYCSYIKVSNTKVRLYYTGSSFDNESLKRVIKEESEALYLKKKYKHNQNRVGKSVNFFSTISQLHDTLKEQFPTENIITYYHSYPFKEMLYIIDGVNLTYKEFGEVFLDCPRSCYSDLIPPLNEITFKCGNCGKIYNYEDVTYETEYAERGLTKFSLDKRDLDDPCCDQYILTWNIIL